MAAPAAVAAPDAIAPERSKTLLSGSWSPEKLARVLVPREQWKPFPTSADRPAWEGLPQESRTALIAAGENRLGQVWPVLPATLFLEFVRTGNRDRYERVRALRRACLSELVTAECAEGRGRFLDDIVNGIWTTCEESYWGAPAHLNLQKAGFGLPDPDEPTVDIFGADTASVLAWIVYLLGPQLDKISPLIRRRIAVEVDRRLLTPNFERVDPWWMGLDPNKRQHLNNWTTWVGSSWLATTLLSEANPARRAETVFKIMRSLDAFLSDYHDDGGCDEGPGYWNRAGASLYDCLELLHSASNGALDFFGVPLIREIGRYIYRVHIAGDWFVNFADCNAKVYVSGHIAFRYGRAIKDEKLQALGAWSVSSHPNPTAADILGWQLPALFNLKAVAAASGKTAPVARDVWMPGIQVMAARVQGSSTRGLYLAAQGGHNAESHNHNDVGNFIVYADGNPAIVDVGVETYTAKMFSAQRYELWNIQSQYHNLPTIDGVMQGAGRRFEATEVQYRADDSAAELSLHIEKAFPEEAGLEFWHRRLRLDRAKNEIEVRDRYSLKKPAGKITLTLMTPCVVENGAAGQLTLGPVRVLFDASVLTPVVEEIKLEDERLRSIWGERLRRVLLVAGKPPLLGEWSVRILQA